MKIHDETHLLAYDTMSLLNKMIENWKDKFLVLCYSTMAILLYPVMLNLSS